MASINRWWTYPAESDNGKTIIVTGRDGMEDVIKSGKYKYRIDVYWNYNSLPDGMPDDEDARMLEQVTDALQEKFKKDKVAYMTGIYTGDGRRDWVFYTKNLNIFSTVFNSALEQLPTLPIVIEAESDPDWEEYLNMREISYIPKDESE